MKRSTRFNIVAVVALTAAVVLFYVHWTWWALLAVVVGAGFAMAAGRAMTSEPRTPSARHDEE